jgi:probable HAF family extracellular repeat protein
MSPRLVRLFVAVGSPLLLGMLLIALTSPNASSASYAPALSPASTATPTETPIPEATDWIQTTAYVTPNVTTVRVGESITVSAAMAVTGTCDYPIYDVTLRSATPLFAFIDPPSSVIGPPGSNPAVWKLEALQTGVTTFTAAFYGETNCGGFWQWHYTWGESPAVTVTAGISSSLNLPALYKATSLNVPAAYKLQSYVPLPPPPPSPTYIDLGTLGGPHSAALDVNNRGQVVGWSAVSADDQSSGEGHAFLWQNGKMRDLGTLGGKYSAAYYINEQAQVAGYSQYGTGDVLHAFFWANGHMTDLGTLGGDSSMVTGLNDLGQVIGTSSTAAGHTHCFVWAAGVMADLGTLGGTSCNAVDINNRGQIVGESSGDTSGGFPYMHAFLWEKGVMTDLTPGNEPEKYSYAKAINEGGQVIGFVYGRSAGSCFGGCAVLWDNGSAIDLWYGGQGFSQLYTINDRGQVVGYGTRKCCSHPTAPYCCFEDALLWDNGTLINLGVQQGRWPNNSTLLNNRGQIVVGHAGQLYLWQDNKLIAFARPSESVVYASAINDAGAVAGDSVTDADGGHALLWQIRSAAE